MGACDGEIKMLTAKSDSSIPSRLLKAITAKFFAEVTLVCVVVTLAAFSTFSPQLRGAIDAADQTRVAGWVVDPNSPGDALEVQLFIDEKLVASKLADEERTDLVQSGVTSTPNHGFKFDLTTIHLSAGRHITQVYALRRATGENKILLPIAKQPSVFEVTR
jgi:hypothetical protein